MDLDGARGDVEVERDQLVRAAEHHAVEHVAFARGERGEPDARIDGGELVNDSITANDLASDSIGSSELANNSVEGANVVNNSLTFSDLASGAATGAVSFGAGSVPAGECENVAIAIGGAAVGDAVVFSVQDALPEGVLLYGVRVTATNAMTALVCNFTGGAMPAVTDVQVRILTFH